MTTIDSEIYEIIRNHYKNGELVEIVYKTTNTLKDVLRLGLSFGEMYRSLYDCGVKLPELNVSMGLALRNVDDKRLSGQDLEVKKRLEKYDEHFSKIEKLYTEMLKCKP